MNAVAAAASRLERWDRRGDWRRFWWALPTVVLGLGIWGGVVGYHHFADAHLVVVSEVIPETFTTGAAPTIVIVDRAGDIRVDAGASPSVAVSVTRLGAGKTTDAAMDDLTSLSLHMDDRQGMVQIVTGEEPGKTTSSEARSTIHVTAPTGSRLSIVTHEGSVVVAGLTGDIAATADHGDVRVELGATASSRCSTARVRSTAISHWRRRPQAATRKCSRYPETETATPWTQPVTPSNSWTCTRPMETSSSSGGRVYRQGRQDRQACIGDAGRRAAAAALLKEHHETPLCGPWHSSCSSRSWRPWR